MSKRVFPILVALLLGLVWAPSTQVEAKPGTCEDGTMIYDQEGKFWVCRGGKDPGPACILCHGEAIDVVG